MKNLIDALQIGLQIPGFGLVICFLLVVLFFQAAKVLGFSFVAVRALWALGSKLVFRFWGFRRICALLILAIPLYAFNKQISNGLQYLEQAYISPTYVVADSSYWAVSCYETELKKHTTEAQFRTVKDSTYKLAADLGCDPLAIYEVAYSECGMNPFCVRTDGVAAGWIQFTRLGLSGFGVSLDEVKRWCRDKDAVSIMEMTGRYMRKWAAGRKLGNSAGVYCAVFAPGKIGHSDDAALYSGWNNPEYCMNKGLDGFVLRGNKALYLPYTMDGKLTKNDLTAALAYKKAGLLKKYK